jgi:hypothetical protein
LTLRTRTGAARVVLALGLMGLPSTAFTQPGVDPLAPIAASLPSSAVPQDPLAPDVSPATELSSAEAARITNWVITTGDNGGAPFIVIDKTAARVFVFDAGGQQLGSAPALLGITRGDDSAPGIGDRELRKIPVEDRTTPAGRFVGKFGPAAGGSKVLWVDYASALSLHAVVAGTKQERRLQRLNSRSPTDNRITYGCINVPAKFYASVIRPLFGKTAGVIYILPETKPLSEVFLALRD